MAGGEEFREVLLAMGSELRAKRESLGISIDEASSKTRIRAQYLIAVEAGDDDIAPGSTYFKAFLKTYATFLGLDGSKYSLGYQAAIDERDAPSNTKQRGVAAAQAGQPGHLATGGGRRAGEAERSARPESAQDRSSYDTGLARPYGRASHERPSRPSGGPQAVEGSIPKRSEHAGQTQAPSDPASPQTPSYSPRAGSESFTPRTGSEEYGSVPTVRSVSAHRPARRTRKKSNAPAIILLVLLIAAGGYYAFTNYKPEPLAPPASGGDNPPDTTNPPDEPGLPVEPVTPAIPDLEVVRAEADAENLSFTVNRTPIELTMKTTSGRDDNCWVRVTLDGEVAYEKTLEPGAEETVTAESTIEIRSGKPWVMSVVINGEDQGLTGEYGPVRDITVTYTP